MKNNYTTRNILLGLFLCLFISNTKAQVVELAHWTGENTSTYTYPQSAAGLHATISSATQNYNGLNTYADNRNVWTNTNTSATVDPATAPYLSYIISISAGEMAFDRFVAAGAAPTTAGIKMQLRWSVDAFASSLGDFTPGGSSYNLTSVDLTSHGVISAPVIEFRIYFYAVAGNVFNSDTGPYASLDGTPASYGPFGRSFGVWGDLSVLGVMDNNFEKALKIYPNPTLGPMKVSLGETHENIKVTIRNITGKLIAEYKFKNADELNYEIKGDSGFYLVSFTNEKGKTATIKVLKK